MRGLVHTSDLADDLVGPSAAKTKLRSSSSTSSIIWRVLLNPLQSWLSPPRSNIYEAEDGDWREVQVAAKPKFSQVHLIYQTLYKISVRLDFAVNVFSQVLTVNGAVVLQRDLSEGAGLVHVVDRWAIEHLWKAGWNVGISRSGILFPFLPLET